jgi:hypothetical protein
LKIGITSSEKLIFSCAAHNLLAAEMISVPQIPPIAITVAAANNTGFRFMQPSSGEFQDFHPRASSH